MPRRASGSFPERGAAINAAATAGSELVLAREAVRRPARGAAMLNQQAALSVARQRADATRGELKAVEAQLLTQEPRP